MTDVFSQLTHLSWRGIVLPVTNRRASFSHQEVTHQIQYADGEIVEITVRNNWRFDYTIPFREDLVKGPYRALFTQGLNQFLAAFLDKDPGDLVDPVLGAFRARPLTFVDASDIQRRDGDDVEVSFVEHKTTSDLEGQADRAPSTEAIITDARQIDAQMAVQDWGGEPPTQISSDEQEWTQETPPDPAINPIDAVAGVFRQVERVNQKSKAVFQDTIRRLNALEDAVDASGVPDLVPLKVNARTLRLQTERAERRERAKRRPLRTISLQQDMTPLDIAAMLGLTLVQLIELNPTLANETYVDQGTTVVGFK